MKSFKDFTDDVSGQIIGTHYQQAFVTYEGRKQGQTIYAETEEEIKAAALDYIDSQQKECGMAFSIIYPDNNAWSIKFI